jgi:hypothetical protein
MAAALSGTLPDTDGSLTCFNGMRLGNLRLLVSTDWLDGVFSVFLNLVANIGSE